MLQFDFNNVLINTVSNINICGSTGSRKLSIIMISSGKLIALWGYYQYLSGYDESGVITSNMELNR